MSNSKITKDGWTRDFDIIGGNLRAAENEAAAYVEGILAMAPADGKYKIEVEEHDDWVRVTIQKETDDPLTSITSAP